MGKPWMLKTGLTVILMALACTGLVTGGALTVTSVDSAE